MTTGEFKRYEQVPPEDDVYSGRNANTHIPSSYAHSIKALREYHTGSREGSLTPEEDHELAEKVQAGLVAKEQIKELHISADSLATEEYRESLEATARMGSLSEVKLVESNLAAAAYLARLSVNIVPTKTINTPEGKVKTMTG